MKSFLTKDCVCPSWLCFTFDNRLRKLFQNPQKILGQYIKQGDKVLDIGPGMGYFTFPMAEMVGYDGKVTALDIQEKMLKKLKSRVDKKGIKNIDTQLYDGNTFPFKGKFDLILLFWMYHEVHNREVFIREIKSVVTDRTKIFIAEPKIHVPEKNFYDSIQLLLDGGFHVIDRPNVFFSRAVVLMKE
ncbi:MAG: class I SAM-dependent methyltransferase [Spirochaetes bacterium]|nr:class I SAM-dependent methyltransferase [Spirochaetota bacterium]